MGARHVQQLGGLSRRKFLVGVGDADRPAFCQIREETQQRPRCGAGKRNGHAGVSFDLQRDGPHLLFVPGADWDLPKLLPKDRSLFFGQSVWIDHVFACGHRETLGWRVDTGIIRNN